MTISVSAGMTEIIFLRNRLQIDISKFDRAALALQANRAVRRIAVVAFVLKQAIDVQRDRFALTDNIIRVPLAGRFFIREILLFAVGEILRPDLLTIDFNR